MNDTSLFNPETRKEQLLYRIATGTGVVPEPVSRIEKLLYYIAQNGTSAFFPTFDATQTYAKGDFVYKDGKVYKALTNVSAGAFNPSDWTESTVAEELTYIEAQLPKKADLGADGKILASQLPPFIIADLVVVDTYAELPAVGDGGKIYQVTSDPDPEKNGYYRWVGDNYTQLTSEDNWIAKRIVGADYTMGRLYDTVEDISTNRLHVVFDLSGFITDGWVCLIHFIDQTHCEIVDQLSATIYGIGETFTSEQTVSDYVMGASLDLRKAQLTTEGIPYLTTAPTEANPSGVKLVILDTEPTTKYNGYLYFIKEE